jgi:hypothetical protein
MEDVIKKDNESTVKWALQLTMLTAKSFDGMDNPLIRKITATAPYPIEYWAFIVPPSLANSGYEWAIAIKHPSIIKNHCATRKSNTFLA